MRMLAFLALAFCLNCIHGEKIQASEPTLFQVGKVKVWSILDAKSEMDVPAIFPGATDIIQQYIPGGKTESNVLTYLYLIDGKYILADTGLGSSGGEQKSRLMENLSSLGVKPEDIDIVMITHMHGDHIGGLISNGEKAFPNATLKLSRIEHDYWFSEENQDKNPARKINFDMARAVVDAYKDKLEILDFGQPVAPGLIARDAVGHTPGHTALYLESEGQKLLCVADMIHAAALQFPRPDMSPRYDMDPEKALLLRGSFLSLVASENIPIAGMHLPYPGIGWVDDNGDGSFTFIPLMLR